MEPAPLDLPEILKRLTLHSRRPRYALMVLTLLAEAADRKGQAGPLIATDGEEVPVRLWLGATLARLSAHHQRRAAMRDRVVADARLAVAARQGADDPEPTADIIEAQVEERARAVGGANVSRAVTDLVRCGLVRRQYVGRWTRHARKGGQRHAAYIVSQDALAALRRGTQLI